MRRSAAVLAALLVAGGCSGAGDRAEPSPEPAPEPTPAAAITVALTEFSVTPVPKVGIAGDVTFTVTNLGTIKHEFVVAKTDLEPGALPTGDDGSVDEEEIDVTGEVEELEPKKTDELKLGLESGTYVLFCDVVDENEAIGAHYKRGMRTSFTVS